MSEREQWIGIKDLASELDISLSTIYQWRAKGSGPRGARFGRHVRFHRADIDAWIAGRMDRDKAA